MEFDHGPSENDADQLLIYGSFFLGDCEYAIDARHIQEVVVPVGGFAPIPRSQDVVEGWYNLRGEILPVLNLGKLFGLPRSEAGESVNLAIVSANRTKVGLIFDATGEIIRLPRKNVFSIAPNNLQPLCGVLEKDQHIVQILDLDVLKELAGLPALLTPTSPSSASARQIAARARKGIAFSMKAVRYAIDIDHVKEIAEFQCFTDVGISVRSETYLGLISLRGDKLPVVDLNAILGLGKCQVPSEGSKRAIVIEIEHSQVGFYVESLDGILAYSADELISPIPMGSPSRTPIKGCIGQSPEEQVLLLDASVLHTIQAIRETATSHGRLFGQVTSSSRQKARRNHERTYVLFDMGQVFGINIADVQEIINLPVNLPRSPASPAFVQGMLRLRQEMLYVLDLKTLFGLASSSEDVPDKKIVVISAHGSKFGLIVDAVRSLVSIPLENNLSVPKYMLGEAVSQQAELIGDVVLAQENGNDGNTQIAILDLRKLIETTNCQFGLQEATLF